MLYRRKVTGDSKNILFFSGREGKMYFCTFPPCIKASLCLYLRFLFAVNLHILGRRHSVVFFETVGEVGQGGESCRIRDFRYGQFLVCKQVGCIFKPGGFNVFAWILVRQLFQFAL